MYFHSKLYQMVYYLFEPKIFNNTSTPNFFSGACYTLILLKWQKMQFRLRIYRF